MAASIALTPPQVISAARVSALALIGAALIEVLALAQHPHIHAHDMAQAISQLSELSASFARVHGAVITALMTTLVGLIEFASRRGLARPVIRAALTAYGAGVLLMVAAALIEGTLTPRLATHALGAHTAADPGTAQLLNLCLQLNEAFAGFGVVAMAVGIGLWSLDLVRASGATRALGVLGVLGLVGAAVFVLGPWELQERGLLGLIGLQVTWCAGAGLLLWRPAHLAYQPMP
jgi:multisubunit Na+/H+ antiporter MnhC subunit